jgi:hypothetical protein
MQEIRVEVTLSEKRFQGELLRFSPTILDHTITFSGEDARPYR